MGTDPKQPLTLICDFEEAKFYILSVNVEELKTHVFAPDLDWALFVAFNRRKMDSIVLHCITNIKLLVLIKTSLLEASQMTECSS